MVNSDALSVLVVDEENDVLAFFARILHTNGMRALLARTADEAVGIARRGYVPIDLVLTDVFLPPDGAAESVTGRDLAGQLRQLRPGVPVLYMSAYLDTAVIRIELMYSGLSISSRSPDYRGLIDSIRAAAASPVKAMAARP